jgi:surfeit locus 1 family protein
LRKYDFKPSWPVSFAVLLMIPLFVSLGMWQLDRAAQKQALMDLRVQNSRAEAVPLPVFDALAEADRYRPVMVTGEYDGAHSVLLDNQVAHGQAGYHVFTPLRIAGADYAVLVNRGWVRPGRDRQDLPHPSAPVAPIRISGVLDRFASVGLKLQGGDRPTEGWPAVVQWVTPELLEARLGYRLLPYQVLLSDKDENGFERDWQQVDLHPEKSLGYAFQWFSFAVTLLFLYVWYGLRRRSGPCNDKHNVS